MIYWNWQSGAKQPELARGVCPPGLLGPEEAKRFARLINDKRRGDWLVGRWTAKQLLRALTGQTQPAIALEALMIRPEPSGAIIGLVPGCPPWALSISHSHGMAVCAAADWPEAAIGIDLDYVEPRSEAFVQDFLTVEEQALVDGLAVPQRDLAIMIIWCAKEAALKALHTGLTVDTRTVSCAPQLSDSPQAGWRPLAITVDEARLGQSAPRLGGWWRSLAGWAAAVVATRQQAAQGPPRRCPAR